MAGLRGPTVARVFPKEPTARGDWFALTVVVNEDALLPAVESLRRAGASEITATPVRYVFEHRSWTFESLERQLATRDVQAAHGVARRGDSMAEHRKRADGAAYRPGSARNPRNPR